MQKVNQGGFSEVKLPHSLVLLPKNLGAFWRFPPIIKKGLFYMTRFASLSLFKQIATYTFLKKVRDFLCREKSINTIKYQYQ